MLPILALLVLAPVQAEDDDDLGLISIDDIDLGDGPAGRDVATSSTYTGALNERKAGLGQMKPVTISHYGGPISVRCQEGDIISARIDYQVEGTNEPNMERYGKGIRLKVWGSETSAGAKTITPSKGSGITSTSVPLVVTLPKQVKLTVNAGSYWVEVMKCEGTVTVANKKDDVWVQGDFSRFSISAPNGGATVKLQDDTEVTGTSKITAKGEVLLEMPLGVNVRLSARGTDVEVGHVVDGPKAATSVSGTIGAGGPSVTVSGRDAVKITSP